MPGRSDVFRGEFSFAGESTPERARPLEVVPDGRHLVRVDRFAGDLTARRGQVVVPVRRVGIQPRNDVLELVRKHLHDRTVDKDTEMQLARVGESDLFLENCPVRLRVVGDSAVFGGIIRPVNTECPAVVNR